MEQLQSSRQCVKLGYIGAVTLVHFSTDGTLLYVGVGPTLFLYDVSTGKLVAEHTVMSRGILHGCDFVNGVIAGKKTLAHVGVFFGQKRISCFKNLPQTSQDAATQTTLERVGKTKVLSDWVFDVQILSEDHQHIISCDNDNAFPLLAVGLAHNFVQIWDPATDSVLRTVQCNERCILYALAFYGRSLDTLMIASGTVFQQILLWQFPTDKDQKEASPLQRLHSHDGVIFKLEWSNDASKLVSVSDDRTVQLWSREDEKELESSASAITHPLSREFRPAFRSWGHSARLWDAKICKYGVATTSEDALCKIWDFDGNCIATLQGHMGKHVWRVAVHPTQLIIATGGGDGAVKLWDLRHQLASTASSTRGSFATSIPIIVSTLSDNSNQSNAKKQDNTLSIRDVVIVDSGENEPDTGFVASEHGQIFQIDLKSFTSQLFFTVRGGNGGNVSSFSLDSSNRYLLIGDSFGHVTVIEIATAIVCSSWKAHRSRIMKIWWKNNGQQNSSLYTSSVDGGFREWQSSVDAVSGQITMQFVDSFAGAGNCAASSIVVIDKEQTRSIICGDGRGSVFVFHRSLAASEAHEQAAQNIDNEERLVAKPPAIVLKNVHGREQVASLVVRDHVLHSGGHDGYICRYLLDVADNGAVRLRVVGRESIKGMATIKQLSWTKQNELLVFGFHASVAILHNFTAQYRLFSIECGGWRRPHALVTKYACDQQSAIPSHTFVFTPPVTKKTDVEMKVHRFTLSTSSYQEEEEGNTMTSFPFQQLSLHDRYHGRMTTCAAFVGDRLVTTGEDNSIKLHILQQTGVSERWTCVSTGVAHTTTVRALTYFEQPQPESMDYIILSGGGKQRLNVWKVSTNVDIIQFLCGYEREDALQDHRILGLATFAICELEEDQKHYRLVVACNSEGSIQLLLLDLVNTQLLELGECSSSKKPILSCSGYQHPTGTAILAVGSTDGMVNLWNFSPVLQALSSSLAQGKAISSEWTDLLHQMQPSASYLAHDMGVNCISIIPYEHEKSSSSFSVISGGDDQSIALYELSLSQFQVLNHSRAINASGSAIKTIYSDGKVVFIGGYDQRVSKWAINTTESPSSTSSLAGEEHQRILEWQCAAFAECADIADLAVRGIPADPSVSLETAAFHFVVVVGQGLQTIKFLQ